jgi:hypothetical protein
MSGFGDGLEYVEQRDPNIADQTVSAGSNYLDIARLVLRLG